MGGAKRNPSLQETRRWTAAKGTGMGTNNLWSFFKPEGVAVIGASDSRGKLGHEILKNLMEGGFPGALCMLLL